VENGLIEEMMNIVAGVGKNKISYNVLQVGEVFIYNLKAEI
jgi:hypothetical protein